MCSNRVRRHFRCLRSKRSRTKRTKFGPPKESFGPREKWGQSKKVEGRGWGRGKQMGVFQNLGVCGQAFPSFPSPTPFLPPFCSRPIFRGSRMRKTDTRCPNFVRFVRERLLRRLTLPQIVIFKMFIPRSCWLYGINLFRYNSLKTVC